MKLQLAALLATFTIAVAALVLAVWPAVADAPWEDDTPAISQPADRTGELRCEGALRMREAAVESRSGVGIGTYNAQMSEARREINLYC